MVLDRALDRGAVAPGTGKRRAHSLNAVRPLHDGAGIYHCAGCGQPLFDAGTKFNSGTGWPSFWAPLEDGVETETDRSFFMSRTEVHCRRCGGHLGHVFEDGPAPTGQRYCMNGVSLEFHAGETAEEDKKTE